MLNVRLTVLLIPYSRVVHFKTYHFYGLSRTGRRRKIKCIYLPNSPQLCAECYARGVDCVTQERTNPPPPKQRKNVRERVSRLEHMLDGALKDLSENKKILQNLQNTGVVQMSNQDSTPPFSEELQPASKKRKRATRNTSSRVAIASTSVESSLHSLLSSSSNAVSRFAKRSSQYTPQEVCGFHDSFTSSH